MYRNISFDPNKRIIVISDIHGELSLFKDLLNKCNYQPVEDYLIILGDIIEKGSDNLNTLHFVMELAKSENVFICKGNCDRVLEYFSSNETAMLDVLKFLKEEKNSIFNEKARQLGKNIITIDDLKEIADCLSEERAFLDGLDIALISDRLIFVHAGIRNLEETNLRYLLSTRTFLSDGHSFSQYVVVGHFPTKNYSEKIFSFNPHFDFNKRIISIDGGNVVANGQLNALIITNNDGYLSFTYRFANRFLPKLFKDRIIGNDENKCNLVCWPNYEVNIIEQSDNHSLVLTQNQKYVKVKSRYLRQKEDKWFLISDYTDYYHSINVPVIGYIIDEDDVDYLVNINGKIGWIAKERQAIYE